MIPMAGTADDLVLFATQTSAARQQVQHPLWVKMRRTRIEHKTPAFGRKAVLPWQGVTVEWSKVTRREVW
jgi:hypothetical protein